LGFVEKISVRKPLAVVSLVGLVFVGQDSFAAEYKPGFACPRPDNSDLLAISICANQVMARAELLFEKTYYAHRQQDGVQADHDLKAQATNFDRQLRAACGIPEAGSAGSMPATGPACYVSQITRQMWQWNLSLSGDAFQEAARDIDTHIAAQQRLIDLGFLPAGTKADGVYGDATRIAIVNWQKKQGFPATGFLSNSEVSNLLGAPSPEQVVAQAAARARLAHPPPDTKNASASSDISGENKPVSISPGTGAIQERIDAVTVAAGPWAVKSAGAIGGNLQIVLRDGRVITLPRAKLQCSYEDVQIAKDDMTIGWSESSSAFVGDEDESNPCAGSNGPEFVFDGPHIWRAGKIIRNFDEGGQILEWSFYGKGTMIGIHGGPNHFDTEQEWDLYSIATGKMLKKWRCSDKKPPPDWASPDLELCPQ